MDVLSIGNSFSEDSQRYLNGIAKADGVELNTFNLFIGGCSLARHYRNMLSEQREYTLQMNGESTGFKVSLKEALLNREWDVVTVQQVSNESPYYDTYQPYLDQLVKYIRECVPKAEIAVHQTWAYEHDSYRLNVELGYSSHTDMFKDIKLSYQKAADEIDASFIIPSGEVFQSIIANGTEKVHRDTFHASLGAGRYLLALCWYKALTKKDISNNTFDDFDEPVTESEREIVIKAVNSILA